MIELKQRIQDTGIGFSVTGEKQELLHMVKWLSFYGQGDKIQLGSIPENKTDTMSAEVFLDEDVHETLSRIDFAALFKLTFFKFELNLPDASNSKSALFEKLQQLEEMLENLGESGAGLDSDILDQMRDETDL